jgi:AAA+ superfamily predicted ATPase
MKAAVDQEWLSLNQQYLSAAVSVVRAHLSAPDAVMPAQQKCDEILKVISRRPALDDLCAIFGLSSFERNVLLLCAGMELDGTFASTCGEVQSDPQRFYPTIGLALSSLPDAHWNALTPNGPLRYWRLIEFAPAGGSPGAPLTTRPIRIDERALHYLTGLQHLDERLASLAGRVRSVEDLLPSQYAIAGRMASAWMPIRAGRGSGLDGRQKETPPVIMLHGPDRLTARAVAATACGLLNVTLYQLSAHALPSNPAELRQFQRLWDREAMLNSTAVLLDCEDAPAEPNREPAVSDFVESLNAPLIVIAGERRDIRSRPTATFELPRTATGEQRAAWVAALNGRGHLNGHVDRLASQFNLNLTQIRSAAREMDRAEDSHFDAVWDACRNQTRSHLDNLAQRIDSSVNWDDLVLPETQKDILRDIVAQVNHRSTVYETWGFGGKSTRGLGISALFSGGSGTGKTMAAEVLAGALRLDLYRIDLSSLVSKYIGETEKNLRRVFDAAEGGGAILLFDEADALFGKRSEVRDSHDRYANIEVSYLLQRMESYRGLAILTTNMKSALDTAFLRRIRFIVQFPFPDAAQRAEIWRRIFPKSAPAKNLDVHKLAQLNVAGGNIRNMALTAAFVAAESGRPIHMSHILRAARAEYAKLEKPLTDAEIAGWAHEEEAVAE